MSNNLTQATGFSVVFYPVRAAMGYGTSVAKIWCVVAIVGQIYKSMKWKIPSYWLLCAFLVSSSLIALLRQTCVNRDSALNIPLAPCNSGAAKEGAANRCYDDGYVYVDVSGNAESYTTHWGYQNASQIQNGQIFFHRRNNLDANTVQVVVDTYDLGGVLPPAAPYTGSFQGPGPCLHDTPSTRSTNVFTLPVLAMAVQNVDAPVQRVSGRNETASRTPVSKARQDHLAKQ